MKNFIRLETLSDEEFNKKEMTGDDIWIIFSSFFFFGVFILNSIWVIFRVSWREFYLIKKGKTIKLLDVCKFKEPYSHRGTFVQSLIQIYPLLIPNNMEPYYFQILNPNFVKYDKGYLFCRHCIYCCTHCIQFQFRNCYDSEKKGIKYTKSHSTVLNQCLQKTSIVA